ncbi:MAG: hypothetical protein RDV48_25280 [Candidatus Eremiobacteraeota bacterium]|nr:hypothetical protein [Candidatus Eremiobacteraeota bacterium]
MKTNLYTVIALVLAAVTVTALIGCGCSGTSDSNAGYINTGSSNAPYNPLNPEEPLVTIRSRSAKADVTITGYAMDVKGTNPDGSSYNYPDFTVKGAGLQGISQPPYGLQQFTYPYMYLLANKSGANCVRLYGAAFANETPAQQANDVDAALTWARSATSNGTPMFVAVGITMGDSNAIDYTNTQSGSTLMAQRQNIQTFVNGVIALNNDRQLLWIIGNELVKSSDPAVHAAVYTEIDYIAKNIIQAGGSNLPCMTAVPTVTTAELEVIAANCPDLQILGINDYYGTFGTTSGGGFLNTLASTMTASQQDPNGWQKPYIVSEFGSYDLGGLNMPTITLPPPPAYVPQGIYALEANSTLVAADYYNNYQTYIVPALTTGCVGSFCYVYENPVYSALYAYFFEMVVSGPLETPSYNPNGRYRLQAVDQMISAWGGTSPGTAYPQIVLGADQDPQGISCSFKATQQNMSPSAVSPGAPLTASVKVNFSGSLTYTWYIVDDTANHYSPQNYEGTASNPPAGVSQNTVTSGGTQTNTVTFNAPQTAGNYQLRVTIVNGTDPGPGVDPSVQGTAATAAVYFQVGSP